MCSKDIFDFLEMEWREEKDMFLSNAPKLDAFEVMMPTGREGTKNDGGVFEIVA